MLAVAVWAAVCSIFIVSGVSWLALPDPGVYWGAAQNLLDFNPEVPAGYPLIWRGLASIFPFAPPALLGQAISFLCYVALVPVAYAVLTDLSIPFAWPATLAIVLFPFVGVTTSVMPRSNALVRLVIFVAMLAFLRKRGWLLVCALAVLPLLHRSGLPFAALLALIGLRERQITPRLLVPLVAPLAAYWTAGAIVNGHALWYLTWVAEPVRVLNLPIADGLIGTVAQGVRGSIPKLIKGVLVIGYWFVAACLLGSSVCRSRPWLAAAVAPAVFFGLWLPAAEIWSTVVYTTQLAVPLAVWLHRQGYGWVERRPVWIAVLSGCVLSQFAWAAYMVRAFSR